MNSDRRPVATESDTRTAEEFAEARSDILSSAPGDRATDPAERDSDAPRITVTEDESGVRRIDVRDDAPIKPGDAD